MRITALALDSNPHWPGLRTDSLAPGLNVFHGPAGAGKTTLADLIAHALFGKRLFDTDSAEPNRTAAGEVLVESEGREFRLRRSTAADGQSRLTVAALDGAVVDRGTVRQFLGGLSPQLAAPIYAVGASQNSLEELLSTDYLRGVVANVGSEPDVGTASQKAELVAERDNLAAKLQQRIAEQRQESRELDQRWRELDQAVQKSNDDIRPRRERLRAVDAALAEVDARLRYLELEATIGHGSSATAAPGWELQLLELDEQIAQWRTMLAKLQLREKSVRGEVAQIRPDDEAPAVTLADQRAWLAVARRWAADLEGEIARLARATQSQSCVCHDAHPRLQPLVDTIARQLAALDSLVDQQQRAANATELSEEADDLGRSQAALQRQLEHLLERRQALVRSTKPSLRPATSTAQPDQQDNRWRDMQQLDQRRWQLQKEHGELLDELARLEPHGRELQAERDAVDRRRAGLLSAQSIEDWRSQLAAVQRRLECATHAPSENGVSARAQVLSEASDLLAQLTDGRLVGLQAPSQSGGPRAVNADGQTVSLESLSAAQHHQVRLSLCLALAAICQRGGIRLPLVLDEPFAPLETAHTAALAAVLDDLARRGLQVLVFTSRPAAIERFAALGAATLSMRQLQHATKPAAEPLDRAPLPLDARPALGAPGQVARSIVSAAPGANGNRLKRAAKKKGA
jgi:DNA repair exonuclease SbcCD ATPase subunit